MKKFLTVIFSLLFIVNSFSIIPPIKGVTPPKNFDLLKKTIEQDYNKGYFAEKTAAREILREKINKGLISPSALVTDTVFALTLLGHYSDTQPIYSREAFQQKLFDGPSPTGTLRDYYNEISYGQMVMLGQCLGWYGVPGNMESYLADNGLGVNGGPRFVYELIQSSDATVNYANYIQYYDNSGNPRIGFIAAVHTGSDAAAGGHNIWSHRWSFTVYSRAPYTTNDIDPVSGKRVIIDGDYAIQPEVTGANNWSGQLIDIGVFAHEFGHIFGLPDLYDTDNSSEGLGNWCLMAGGSYGGNGSTAYAPTHMSIWCKQRLGWITPTIVNSFMKNISIPDAEDNAAAYKVWKNGVVGSKEYFLIENRQQKKFDRFLPNSGLLIFHIDDNIGSNSNENHYKVDLEQADGQRHLNLGAGRGDAGDPFPGTSNNNSFDFLSKPNSNAYTIGPSYVSARNIRMNNGLITADLDNGTNPFLQVSSINFTESVYQNGRVEAGETGNIKFKVRNLEPVNASNAKIKFSFDAPDIEMLVTESNLNVVSLANDSIIINSVFKVKPEFKARSIYVKYEITAGLNTYKDSTKIAVGIPSMLVVSKAENSRFVDYYTAALLAAGLEYEELINSEATYAAQRNTIIIFTGSKSDSLFTQSELDALTSYANNGGHLLFFGQNLAEYLKDKYPSFLTNTVGINWVKNGSPFFKGVIGNTSDVLGNAVGNFKIYGIDGERNERTPDVISSNGSFNMSFHYKVGLVDGAGGWIQKTNSGKIIFLGFGYESISTVESPKSRAEIMRGLLSHFGVTVDVNDETTMPGEFSLSQNYPNPFNPSTKINYTIAKASSVKLELFDITGSRTAVLVNKEQQQGTYSVNVNMQELKLSTGVYFYKLTAGDFTSVKKMMLLK